MSKKVQPFDHIPISLSAKDWMTILQVLDMAHAALSENNLSSKPSSKEEGEYNLKTAMLLDNLSRIIRALGFQTMGAIDEVIAVDKSKNDGNVLLFPGE